jgi:hypothetical protein
VASHPRHSAARHEIDPPTPTLRPPLFRLGRAVGPLSPDDVRCARKWNRLIRAEEAAIRNPLPAEVGFFVPIALFVLSQFIAIARGDCAKHAARL